MYHVLTGKSGKIQKSAVETGRSREVNKRTVNIDGAFCVIVSPPGAVASQKCPVCGQAMVAHRDAARHTGPIAGGLGLTVPHDEFQCENSRFAWHDSAQRLWEEAQSTASSRVRALIEADLQDLIRANWQDRVQNEEVSDDQE